MLASKRVSEWKWIWARRASSLLLPSLLPSPLLSTCSSVVPLARPRSLTAMEPRWLESDSRAPGKGGWDARTDWAEDRASVGPPLAAAAALSAKGEESTTVSSLLQKKSRFKRHARRPQHHRKRLRSGALCCRWRVRQNGSRWPCQLVSSPWPTDSGMARCRTWLRAPSWAS